jgi:hypothetical protein
MHSDKKQDQYEYWGMKFAWKKRLRETHNFRTLAVEELQVQNVCNNVC